MVPLGRLPKLADVVLDPVRPSDLGNRPDDRGLVRVVPRSPSLSGPAPDERPDVLAVLRQRRRPIEPRGDRWSDGREDNV
jgi:hypothetical protein